MSVYTSQRHNLQYDEGSGSSSLVFYAQSASTMMQEITPQKKKKKKKTTVTVKVSGENILMIKWCHGWSVALRPQEP